jgi:hypothetical protein
MGRGSLPWQHSKRLRRGELARPKGFEPLTSAFGGQRSIQLSYGRNRIQLLAEFRSEGNALPPKPARPPVQQRLAA